MPRGDKSKYTDKQDRKADDIAQSYEQRGVPEPDDRDAQADRCDKSLISCVSTWISPHASQTAPINTSHRLSVAAG